MDYDFLRREGIRHIERLGSKQWTDYNTHDPGITILEQLCYALTDLNYRIDYKMPDLLAEGGQDPFTSLFSPAQILTSNPVTLQDLRKLVVDVTGVRNAWIEKPLNTVPNIYFHNEENTLSLSKEDQVEPLILQGLYQVWLEAERGYQGNISEHVSSRLHEYRSLGEDFTIERLGEQKIRINATIEIDSFENLEQLQHSIYEQIENYFSPTIRFSSLQECLDVSKTIDEIFEGPYLEQGFIDPGDLQKIVRRTELRASDLIRILMDIQGIRTIQKLEFVTGGKWLLKLGKPIIPRLDREASQITLIKGDIETSLSPIDHDQANTITQPELGEPQLPANQDKHIGDDYYSIQHQFPDTYGINRNGLSSSASPLRKAQMKQLKAYLLLFDQLLANSFSQLANTGRLFSFADKETVDTTTYFSQLLDDPELGLDEDAQGFLGIWSAPDKSSRRANLEKLVNRPDNAHESRERKNRFLNHLLARFAEQLTDLPSLTQDNPNKPLQRKQTYLQRYAELSRSRHTAPNYRKPAEADTGTGVEQYIRLKLGIKDSVEFYLIEHILLRPINDDQNQNTALLSEIRFRDPYSLQLSVVLPTSLQPLKQRICEEMPAHLILRFPQLDEEELKTFKAAYQTWRQTMSDTTANHQALRSARDRIIDLLGIGRTYPLSDLAVSDEMVAHGEKANIHIGFTQPDVIYQLCDENGNLLEEEFSVTGNGNEALLETPPITKDITYKILACKRLNIDSCKDNPYKVFLQQRAKIRAGLNTHLEAEITRETDTEGNNPLPATLLDPQTPTTPTAARIIHFGQRVEVEVRQSQEGVRYQLFPAKDHSQPALSEEITGEGSGRSIVILSHNITEDMDIHVLASKTLHAPPGNENEQSNWLDTVLPLKVRANPGLSTTTTPILAWGERPNTKIQATQTTASYRAFRHKITDEEFVFGNGHGELLKTSVPDYPDVQVKAPAWQAIWQDVPAGYTETGTLTQGNGGQLSLELDALIEDSLVIIQATKQHQQGDRTIPSAVQLHQAIMLLLQPDPAPPLTLRILVTDETARSIQVANGQAGVFYHFRLTVDGEEISLPVYFHHWNSDDTPEDKGIGQLRIEGDFVVATTETPKTPVTDIITALPDAVTLHIYARKARTNVSTALANTITLPTIPKIQAPQTVNSGDTANIQVQSQAGVRYQLWLEGQMLPPEITGDGSLLALPTGPITQDSHFTVRFIHAVAGGMSVEFDQNILIKVQSA